MIEWGDKRLAHAETREVVVEGISVGSLCYAKAGLTLMIRQREEDRAEKVGQGWPDAALRSLDEGIERIRKIANIIEYEPSDVLWEVIPREARLTEQERGATTEWDAFICHASEDKEDFVRALAEGLRARGLKVWYDEFTLTLGDSLRRSIDRGLARSRFGVVVISPDFLRKEWPQKELDGLVAREVAGVKVILPVWHKITGDEIRRISPTLADRLTVSSDRGLAHVITELMRAIERDDPSLKTVVNHVTPPTPTTADRLPPWLCDVDSRFEEALSAATSFTWPVPLREHCCQLSYLISHSDGPLPVAKLQRILEQANNEVRDTVWTGWSMFHPFTQPEITPSIHAENDDGTGCDLLETNLIDGRKFDTTMPDFWRVTSDGRASIVRGYREDVRMGEPGRWLSPVTILRETAELVRHARAYSQHFPSASAVSFSCTWKGLQGRELIDMNPGVDWRPGQIAKANSRTTTGAWPVDQLEPAWSDIVADLGCPPLFLFGFLDCSPELVKALAPRLITL